MCDILVVCQPRSKFLHIVDSTVLGKI